MSRSEVVQVFFSFFGRLMCFPVHSIYCIIPLNVKTNHRPWQIISYRNETVINSKIYTHLQTEILEALHILETVMYGPNIMLDSISSESKKKSQSVLFKLKSLSR